MSDLLHLSEKELAVLVTLHEQSIEEGNKLIAQGSKMVREAQERLAVIKSEGAGKEIKHLGSLEKIRQKITNSNSYDVGWSWSKKIEYILKEAKTTLSTKEIVDRLLQFEPQRGINRRKVVKNVSAALTTKSVNNRFLQEVFFSGSVYSLKA